MFIPAPDHKLFCIAWYSISTFSSASNLYGSSIDPQNYGHKLGLQALNKPIQGTVFQNSC